MEALKKLKRYDLEGGSIPFENEPGDWVRFEDVEKLVAELTNREDNEQSEIDRHQIIR